MNVGLDQLDRTEHFQQLHHFYNWLKQIHNENQIQAFEDIHHVTSPTHNVGFSYHVFEGI